MANRTPDQMEHDRHFVVKYRMSGHTYDEIADMLHKETGRRMSVSTISGDMLAVRKQWAEQHPGEVHQLLNEELERLAQMERVAWGKFHDAEGNTKQVKRVLERRMAYSDQGEGEWEDYKEVVTIEDMSRHEQFWWQEITKIQQDRRKVLNLYKENIDIRLGVSGQISVKGYVGWSPDEAWPDSPGLQDGETVEGEYIEQTVHGQTGVTQPE